MPRVSCKYFALLVFATMRSLAGQPSVEIAVEPRELFIGESAMMQVTINNSQTADTPDTSSLNTDFDVVFAGGPQRSQQIVNFKLVSLSTTYSFRITPKRAGTLAIPSPVVNVDGQKISGKPAQLVVRELAKQDTVLVEITSSKDRVYPTQPFELTMRILLKPLPRDPGRDPLSTINPVQLTCDWIEKDPDGLTGVNDPQSILQPLVSRQGRGFYINRIGDGWRQAVFSLYTGRETRKGLDGNPIEYYVYELKRKFVPDRTQTLSIGGCALNGTLVAGLSANLRQYTTDRFVVRAEPKTIEVREVPEPRPAGFCGGIGMHSIRASVSNTNLRVGDPFTLNLEIERTKDAGSVDLVSAPDISAVPQMADFNIVDKAPTGSVEKGLPGQPAGNVKKFAYDLRPKKVGVGIPALPIAFFDPNTEKFIELQTQPIALNVVEAAKMNTADVVGVMKDNQNSAIKQSAQGIFQNVSSMAELSNQNVNISLVAGAVAGMWAVYGLAVVFVTTRRRRAGDEAWMRRQRARRDAQDNLSEAKSALAKSDMNAVGSHIHSALAGMIGNMLNLPSAGMTSHEAEAALAKAGVKDELRKPCVKLLETVEASRYASLSSVDAAPMIEQAEKIVPELQAVLAKV